MAMDGYAGAWGGLGKSNSFASAAFSGADELRVTRDRLRFPSCRRRQSFKSMVAVNRFTDLPFVADHLLFHRHRFWRWPLCVRFLKIGGPCVSGLSYLLIIGFQRQRIAVFGHAKILERVHADQDFIQVRINLGIQIPHRDIADFEAVDLRKMMSNLAAGGVRINLAAKRQACPDRHIFRYHRRCRPGIDQKGHRDVVHQNRAPEMALPVGFQGDASRSDMRQFNFRSSPDWINGLSTFDPVQDSVGAIPKRRKRQSWKQEVFES